MINGNDLTEEALSAAISDIVQFQNETGITVQNITSEFLVTAIDPMSLRTDTPKRGVITKGRLPGYDFDKQRQKEITNELKQLTNEQRLEIFNQFCKHCGEAVYLPCYCMADD